MDNQRPASDDPNDLNRCPTMTRPKSEGSIPRLLSVNLLESEEVPPQEQQQGRFRKKQHVTIQEPESSSNQEDDDQYPVLDSRDRSASFISRLKRPGSKKPRSNRPSAGPSHLSVYEDLNNFKTIKSKKMRSCFSVVCDDNTKNIIVKAVFGFVVGIILTGAIYAALHFGRRVHRQLTRKDNVDELPPVWSVGVSAGLSIIWALGLAFSATVRCITLLMLPALCTTRGRAFVAAILLSLIISGPILNTVNNAQLLPEAGVCQANLLINESKAVQEYFFEHFGNVTDRYRQLTSRMINTTISLAQQPFENIKNVLEHASNAAGADVNVKVEVRSITVLGINFTRSDFNASYSNAPEFHRNFFAPDVNSSKPPDYFVKKIQARIAGVAYFMEKAIYILNWVLPWSILLLFAQSFFYRRGYMTRLDYDNIFITRAFIALDKKRKASGKKAILPLRWREKSKFIDSTSILLSSRERSSMYFGLILCAALLLIGVLAFSVDYAFHVVLDALNDQTNTTLTFKGGAGVWPTLPEENMSPSVRALLLQEYPDFFSSNFSMYYDESVDAAGCAPTLYTPMFHDTFTLPMTVGMWVFIFILTLLGAYGLRLQHKLASYFYPDMEKRRIKFLYDRIQAQRYSFAKLVLQRLTHVQDGRAGPPTWSQWIRSRWPCAGKVLMAVGILSPPTCDVCGEDKPNQLMHNVSGSMCCDLCMKTGRGPGQNGLSVSNDASYI